MYIVLVRLHIVLVRLYIVLVRLYIVLVRLYIVLVCLYIVLVFSFIHRFSLLYRVLSLNVHYIHIGLFSSMIVPRSRSLSFITSRSSTIPGSTLNTRPLWFYAPDD